MATYLKLASIAVVFLFVALAACGSEAAPAASDPLGALVRLQRNDAATTLPGDFTVFSNGSLQLYLGDRGALRKTVALADLAGLEAALADPALDTLTDTYPASLPAGAGDRLTIYGAHRRMVRYNPNSLDLPPALQRLISEAMQLRGRFSPAFHRAERGRTAVDEEVDGTSFDIDTRLIASTAPEGVPAAEKGHADHMHEIPRYL